MYSRPLVMIWQTVIIEGSPVRVHVQVTIMLLVSVGLTEGVWDTLIKKTI